MCSTLLVSIGMGAAKAVTGIAEQNRQHQNQVDAVNRSNAIAKQNYLNQIQISAFNDQRKGEVFTAQLQADAASRAAYYRQKELNQAEATRAITASDQKLREKITERAGLMLAKNAPKAAFGIVDVLDDPSSLGASNAISAVREVLDRTGLVKKEQFEVTANGGWMFILPP